MLLAWQKLDEQRWAADTPTAHVTKSDRMEPRPSAMLHVTCASAAADTPLCTAQLIFIGPLGRSYSPQGGNVSPTLVRLPLHTVLS